MIINSGFKVKGDRTEYHLVMDESVAHAQVSWWDCGHQYEMTYETRIVKILIKNGDWILDK